MTPSWSASHPPSTQQNSIVSRTFGPKLCQKRLVTRELPVTISLDNAAHLTVRGCDTEFVSVLERKIHTETHQPAFIHGMEKLHFPHSSGQITEKIRRGLLVIPDMRATAETGSEFVLATFPAEQIAVRR